MPQLQVLDHQPDKSAEALGKFGGDVLDAVYKTQSLKLTGQYYKILAQNADTQAQKEGLERKAKLFDQFLPKIQETKDPATKQMYIKALTDPQGLYQGDTTAFFHDLADGQKHVDGNYKSIPQVQEKLSQMQQDPNTASPQQLAGAQTAEAQSTAAMNQVRADAMRDPASYFAKMSQGMQTMAGGAPNANQPQDPNNPVAQGPVWTGGTVNTPLGDMQYSNPAADMAKSQATTIGSTIGTQQVELTPLKAAIANYRGLLDKGNVEVGGTSGTMAGARTKSLFAHLGAGFRKDSVLPALDQQATQIADTLSTYINKGRSAEYKIKISKDIIPYVDDSKATQDYLNKNLDAMLRIGATGNPALTTQDKVAQRITQASEVVAKDRKFAAALKAQGISQEEIDNRIRKQHERLGL